jgi:hypothetical protein
MSEPLDLAELRQLVQQASEAYRGALAADRDAYEARFTAIDSAIGQLTSLLGPAGAPAGQGSIRAMRGYDEQTLAQHAGLALSLVLQGMEILTATTLDLATIVSRELRDRDR